MVILCLESKMDILGRHTICEDVMCGLDVE